MAAPAAFSATVARCGFTAASVQRIIDSGPFTTAEEFKGLPMSGMKDWINKLTKPRSNDVGTPFPTKPILNLQGLRSWIEYRTAKGEPLDVQLFTGDVIDRWAERVTDVAAMIVQACPDSTGKVDEAV